MSALPQVRTDQINESGVIIRAAEPDDYARARAIQWSAGWKDAPEIHRYWPAPDIEWVNRHYFREFIAEVDGVVAARIGLEAYCPPFAELANLCVRPDYRRHGLGQMLTSAGQREAARMGFSLLFLQTEMDNLGAPFVRRTGLGSDSVRQNASNGKASRLPIACRLQTRSPAIPVSVHPGCECASHLDNGMVRLHN